MRGVGVVIACLGLALSVAGCDPLLEAQYTREGIGTSLYWDGLPTATELQDVYLSNLCGQGVSRSARSIDPVACGGLNLGTRDWGLIVQAGMNDIDLRCDAYLTWLHDKQASKEPILKEMALLGGATAAILKASEVSATPIALTAIAFGLAADSFTDANQRLLNEVDYTTVQTVVRGNRTEFRSENLDLQIDNRPAAIYVLRNYLSICVPASIVMSISNTLTVYHRAGPQALLNDSPIALRNPVATSATSAAVRGAVISDVRKQSPGDFHPAVDPKAVLEARLKDSLCTTQTGKSLNDSLKDFFVGRSLLLGSANLATAKIPNKKQILENLVAGVSDCKLTGFKNAFEVGRFGVTSDNNEEQVKQSIDDLQDSLRSKLQMSDADLKSRKLDDATRKAIAQFRKDNKLGSGNQVDDALISALTSTAKKGSDKPASR